MAIALVAILCISLAVFLGIRSFGDKNVADDSSLPPGITADMLDKMSVDTFDALNIDTRLAYFGPKLDKWRVTSSRYVPDGQSLNTSFPSDKSTYTNQQVSDEYAADLLYITSVETSGVQRRIDTSLKVLSVIMSSENAGYTPMTNILSNGQRAVFRPATTDPTFPIVRVRHQSFEGVSLSNGRIIKTISPDGTGTTMYALYDLLSTNGGKATIWQFVQAFGDDVNIRSKVQSFISAGG